MLNAEHGQMEIIVERESYGRLYKLFSVRIGKLEKHVIYVLDNGEEQFSLFDLNAKDAEDTFDTIVKEGLACEHLSDVAADMAREYQNKSVNF